jgi:hypothetical protein
MAMFSNPMMLLMVFGGIMVFAMPYVMVRLARTNINIDVYSSGTEEYGPRSPGGIERAAWQNS